MPPAAPTDTQLDWCEITLTQRCNQRCFFCYEEARDLAADPDLDSIKALLHDTKKRAGQVVLCGKEVLLRRDVLDIVACAAALDLNVVVFTNGQALARVGLVEQLVEAGCASITVSFHFPDPETFARGTRTSAKGFYRTLQGLRQVASYNLTHPERPLHLSTETDMCALNTGRLAEMRDQLKEAMLGLPWNMRLASLLPTRTYDIGLEHTLASWAESRDELAHFLETHPPDIPLMFVKMPLCLLPPGREHQSLEVEYIQRGTVLTFNHAELGVINTDTITPSRTRDLVRSLENHPYRWVCRSCGLAPLCRFERVDWHSRFFEPTQAQKPIPPATDAAQVLGRLSPGPWQAWLDVETKPLREHRFPEEQILTALANTPPDGPQLVDSYVYLRPVLAVDLRFGDFVVALQLGAPERTHQPLGALIGYLNVQVIPGPVSCPPGVLQACLRAIAAVDLPATERWSASPWFDRHIADLWSAASRRFGEHLWPTIGAIGAWQTRSVTMTADNRLELELTQANGRVLLQYEVERSSERLVLLVDESLAPTQTRRLLASLRDIVGNMRAEVRPMPGESPPPATAQLPGHALRFELRDSTTGESIHFEVVSHNPQQPSFRTVGALDLRYSRGALTPRSTQFARVLLTAMAGLQSTPPGPQSVARWSSVVKHLAQRARLDNVEFELTTT